MKNMIPPREYPTHRPAPIIKGSSGFVKYRVGMGKNKCRNCESLMVFRYQDPVAAQCKYHCMTCGAKDAQAWGEKGIPAAGQGQYSLADFPTHKPKMGCLTLNVSPKDNRLGLAHKSGGTRVEIGVGKVPH